MYNYIRDLAYNCIISLPGSARPHDNRSEICKLLGGRREIEVRSFSFPFTPSPTLSIQFVSRVPRSDPRPRAARKLELEENVHDFFLVTIVGRSYESLVRPA